MKIFVILGKQAVKEYMAETYLDPPKFDLKDIVAEGDFVVAIGEIELTDSSGKTTQYSYSDVWRFEGEKMASLRAFVVEI